MAALSLRPCTEGDGIVRQDVSAWPKDLCAILLLVLAGVGVKGWLFLHTETPARDGIGYIHFAWQLSEKPWSEVLRSNQQHPLYPISIYATSRIVRWLRSEMDCSSWVASAQFANGVAGVLLVIPMFLWGKEVYDRRIAFCGTLLFQVLPVAARATTDALSEGTYLLWAASSLWLGARALRTHHWSAYAGCGLAGGLAYLARPEGALVVLVTGVVAVAARFVSRSTDAWPRVVGKVTLLGLTAAVVASPYWIAIGGLSVKPTFHNVIQARSEPPQPDGTFGPGESLMLAARFMPGTDGRSSYDVSPWFALHAVADETATSFHYLLVIPAISSLWLLTRWRFLPISHWHLLGTVSGSFLVLWRLAYVAQYVSGRHTLLIVLCGSTAAAAILVYWLTPQLQRNRLVQSWATGTSPAIPWPPIRQRLLLYIIAGLCLWGLVPTLRPLHPHRVGHREAGIWLSRHLEDSDEIVDPYGWASFYSGQWLRGTRQPETTRGGKHRYFVIDTHDDDLNRQAAIRRAASESGLGTRVFHWSGNRESEVAVYRAPLKPKRPAVTSAAHAAPPSP